VSAHQSLDRCSLFEDDQMDFSPIADNTLDYDTRLLSGSPDFQGHSQPEYTSPPSPSPSRNIHSATVDASSQARITDSVQNTELCALALDLEAAKREKREMWLFSEWRTHISPIVGSDAHGRPSSPPSDLTRQIIPSWKAALACSSDACVALDKVPKELSSMRFLGNNADEIISKIRDSFNQRDWSLSVLSGEKLPMPGWKTDMPP
jgi:hypothetical protein